MKFRLQADDGDSKHLPWIFFFNKIKNLLISIIGEQTFNSSEVQEAKTLKKEIFLTPPICN